MPEARVVESLGEIGRAPWDSLFPGSLETYDYLLAVEQAGLPDFRWRYVTVSEGDSLLAAARSVAGPPSSAGADPPASSPAHIR
jgi:hypothetical protein